MPAFRGKPHERLEHLYHGRHLGARGHAGLRVLCPYGRLLQVPSTQRNFRLVEITAARFF